MEVYLDPAIPNPPASIASLAICNEADPTAARGFNVNRGAQIRFTPEGAMVGMYWDLPGVFYDAHGREVPTEFAKRAGFNTDPLLLEREKMRARSLAVAQIDAQYGTQRVHEVEEVRGSYQLVNLGADRYNVEFDDGSPVNVRGPITLSVAKALLDALVPPEPAPEPAPEPIAKKGK